MAHKYKQETKEVMLRDNPFLASLTDKGMTFQGRSPNTVIKVVAVEGYYDDWSAYFQTPWTPFSGKNVADWGNKLPEEAAAQLFPEWAKRLKWRP